MKRYLAIDIGASSGRHIVGWQDKGELQTEEVYRFPNGVTRQDRHLIWDIGALLEHVRTGIDRAQERYPDIVSLSVDTWGVDYVLMQEDREILPCYAYRDSRTQEVIEKLHAVMPFEELYRHTGTQFQPFNTVYQLYWDHLAGRLEQATSFRMIPEYLMSKLCGNSAHEYTNATTTGMINAETGEYDREMIRRLGLPERLFDTLEKPGKCLGTYKGMKVVLCATHDTGSAVEGIPMDQNMPYISSGTWSLLGVKTPRPLTGEESRQGNWSNEGGVGYNRYQKNIMGMWLINRLRDDLCPEMPFPEIVELAQSSTFDEVVNADDACFLAPESMKAAFDQALAHGPVRPGDYFRCAYRSLAGSYARALLELERNTGSTYSSLVIVGGGAKNAFLNRLTEEATGKTVLALPIEATALGNLYVQMQAEENGQA